MRGAQYFHVAKGSATDWWMLVRPEAVRERWSNMIGVFHFVVARMNG